MFAGVDIIIQKKRPNKTLNGFYGFRINLDLIGVKVVDSRGRGLSGVSLEAINPEGGILFSTITDNSGSAYMRLEENTEIKLSKDSLVKHVYYNGDISPKFKLDTAFLL